MQLRDESYEELLVSAESILEETAERLHQVLAELASRLSPFPGFMGMVSVQAVELEPPFAPRVDRGCVVVLSSGEICRLDLAVIPGADMERAEDHIEEFRELDLPMDEFIVYANTAIKVLAKELRRRSG